MVRDDVGLNFVPQHLHALGLWFAASLSFACGPGDGVVFADAECGYYVVAATFDVSSCGGVVDGLVVDAGEGFGLAEGYHVWVVHVDGLGGHGVFLSAVLMPPL